MTEGIIQKIIKQIVLDSPATWYHRSTFITLEQELIEAIKKEVVNVVNESDKTQRQITDVDFQKFLFRLLGDNQE